MPPDATPSVWTPRLPQYRSSVPAWHRVRQLAFKECLEHSLKANQVTGFEATTWWLRPAPFVLSPERRQACGLSTCFFASHHDSERKSCMIHRGNPAKDRSQSIFDEVESNLALIRRKAKDSPDILAPLTDIEHRVMDLKREVEMADDKSDWIYISRTLEIIAKIVHSFLGK
jgi:hypothetical protein